MTSGTHQGETEAGAAGPGNEDTARSASEDSCAEAICNQDETRETPNEDENSCSNSAYDTSLCRCAKGNPSITQVLPARHIHRYSKLLFLP